MRLFMGNGELSQSKLIGINQGSAPSESWDLESSQASNHFENIGKFNTHSNLDFAPDHPQKS